MESIERKHIAVTICMILLSIGSILGILYFVKEMQVKERRVREVKEHLASYEQNKKIFIAESVELRELDGEVARLEDYTVTIEQVPQLLSRMEALALESGVTFSIISVKTPEEEGAPQTLTVDFSAGGSYASVQAFLEVLSRQSYQIRFNTLSLHKRQSETPLDTITLPSWELLASTEIVSF